MRVLVTGRSAGAPPDLRPAAELAPSLALPWIVRLRFGVILGEICLILAAHFAFKVELALQWLWIPLALTAASNLLLHRITERFGTRPTLGYVMVFDTVALTALLALSGGPTNPFTLLYLVQITLSAVVLSRQWTWSLGLLSVAGFASLFWASIRVPVFEAHHMTGGFSTHLVGMWIAFAAGALLITIFIGKVSESLRRREQEVLQLRDQLARQERLGSVATLAAGAAHELGTPLGTIAVASKELEYYATRISKDPQVAEDARLVRAEVERCGNILRQMSARGAEQPGETPAVVKLSALLDGVRGGFPKAAQERIEIALAADGAAVLPVGAATQALAALVKNALEASEDGRPVRLDAARGENGIRLTVVDAGKGMSQEVLNRVAEPFFTTKTASGGMGLGTFLVRAFAERLGGGLIFDSEAGKGCTAILDLPICCDDKLRETSGIDRR
jgi:two-component system, sensor histidine kinase RegB